MIVDDPMLLAAFPLVKSRKEVEEKSYRFEEKEKESLLPAALGIIGLHMKY